MSQNPRMWHGIAFALLLMTFSTIMLGAQRQDAAFRPAHRAGFMAATAGAKSPPLDYNSDLIRIIPAILLWVVFTTYWSSVAQNSAPTRNSEPKTSSYFHQFVANGAVLLLLLPVPGLTARFLPATLPMIVIGFIVQAGFVLLAVWARRHLGANWSAAVRVAVDHQLVQTGPYCILRHPIYTAVLGMYVGTSIASGQVHALLALAIIGAAYWRKVRLEEQILEKTFGAEYDAYRQHTWALIPLLF